jgi:dGTPase
VAEFEKWDRYIGERQDHKEAEEDFLGVLDESQRRQFQYSKDYDRILYSTAFRRLGGVAQVVTAGEVALFHNRLTHSLKTAQVGTRLANHLARRYAARKDVLSDVDAFGGVDARVVRAACMAHDLGHPPFGHIAETELQRILSYEKNKIYIARAKGRKERVEANSVRSVVIPDGYRLADSFEGNAQSFRIITKLAFREYSTRNNCSPALNLTKASLAATLKYPWSYEVRPPDAPDGMKWSYYNSESEIAEWALTFGGERLRSRSCTPDDSDEPLFAFGTVEAQLMDWADDISYAVHDAEDFFRAGLIPLHQLRSGPEWDRFLEYAWPELVRAKKFKAGEREWADEQLGHVRRIFPSKAYEGFGSDREDLHKFASTTIVNAIRGTDILFEGIVAPSRKQRVIIEVLKRLTWYYVIDRPSLQSAQFGQRQMIRSLYRILIEWVEEAWLGLGSGRPSARSSEADPADGLSAVDHRRPELPARLLSYLDIAMIEGSQRADDNGDSAMISRAVVDYLVSLTEAQTIELHARLTGDSARSMLESWVQL